VCIRADEAISTRYVVGAYRAVRPEWSLALGKTDLLKSAISDDARYVSEVRHPLTHKDEEAVAAIRVQVAPSKGKTSGPEARAPFDEVMEHVPDAPGVGKA